jgi:serine phosphatase RsbU (regulator of sigma subunit)
LSKTFLLLQQKHPLFIYEIMFLPLAKIIILGIGIETDLHTTDRPRMDCKKRGDNVNKIRRKKRSFMRLIASKYTERSIARDLAVYLVLFLSATFLCAGLIAFLTQTREENKELKSEISRTTYNLSMILALPMWTYNDSEIKTIVSSQALSHAITGISIIDESGKSIINTAQSQIGKDIAVTRDVIYKGRKIGKVTVFSSTTPLYYRAFKNLLSTLGLALLAIIVVCSIILPLLDRFLDQPLSRLAHAIQRIASGQYRFKLPDLPQKELSSICHEVNFMAEKIELRESQIRESMRATTILKTEIGIAETIQRSMTATQGVVAARRVAQFYEPMNNLSGDWMTTFECDKNQTIYAMIGDVTGHGIPQGLVTMAAFGAAQTLRPLIQQNSRSFPPSVILNILRSTLVTLLHDCELAMTVSVIKIDIPNQKLTLSSAGHPFPIAISPDEGRMRVRPLTAQPQSPLGFEFLTRTTAPPAYVDTAFDLHKNETICLFSDGLTESVGKSSRPFQKPFIGMLKSLDRPYPPSILLDRIIQNFKSHLGGQSGDDDVCLMIIDTRKDDHHEVAA